MEEKTAKIPSLKEFKESRKEKEAHSERSKSMQSKSQMKRSVSKAPSENEKRPPRDSSRQRSEAHKRDSVKRTPSTRTPAKGYEPERVTAREYTGSKSQSRTYVRDRMDEEKRAKRPSEPQRVPNSERNEELRQYRKQSSRPPQRTQRVPSNPPKAPSKKKKKPSKPMSPKMRKIRNIMVYVGIIAVVLIVAIVLSLTVLFKTEQIIVSGNEMYSAEQIIEASGLSYGANIFTANKSAAAEKIEKAYPYIEDAHVYFSIPDSIKIDVKMAEPAYMIEALGGFHIVSDKGKVLEVASTDDEAGVPVIEGVTVQGKAPGEFLDYGSGSVSKALTEIFTAFRELDCKNITAVNVESKNDTVKFKYVYDDRIVVYLGTPEHLTHKIHTADTVIKEKLDVDGSNPIGELDVSRSYETKKSYFNEYSILADNVAPKPTESAPTTQSQMDPNYEGEDYNNDNAYVYE